MLLAWLAIGPLGLGNRFTYVIVDGNSMYPRLHKGDLVIVRKRSHYGVGQIVTYRHPQIGPVIHRIIAEQDGRFVMQGDHNTWTDSYNPRPQDVIGRYWFMIPGAGTYVAKLRDPYVMAVAVGIVGVIMVSGATSEPNRRRQPGATPPLQPAPTHSTTATLLDQRGRETGTLLGVVAALALAVLLFAWLTPATHEVPASAPYQQTGAFTYTAAAGDGVYDGGTVGAGQPVFRQLTEQVNLAFAYQLKSDTPADASGMYSMSAVVSDNSGWQRTLELTPPTAFSGTSASIAGTLDLNQIQRLIDTMQLATGVSQSVFNIAVTPAVTVNGTLANLPLSDTFAPTLLFQLDPLKLTLSGGDGKDAGQLQPAKDGSVKFSSQAPTTFGALGYGVSLATARLVALATLGVCLLGLLWLGAQTLRLLRADEARQIRARHGELLVNVSSSDATSGRSVVEMDSFEELRRFAVAHGRMIMHYPHDGRDDFYLREDGAVYCYRTSQLTPRDDRSEPHSDHDFDATGPLPAIERRAPGGPMRHQRTPASATSSAAAPAPMRMRHTEC